MDVLAIDHFTHVGSDEPDEAGGAMSVQEAMARLQALLTHSHHEMRPVPPVHWVLAPEKELLATAVALALEAYHLGVGSGLEQIAPTGTATRAITRWDGDPIAAGLAAVAALTATKENAL